MIYNLRKDKVTNDLGETFTAYGIDIEYDGKLIASYPDFSFDIDKVEQFLYFCRRMELPPEKLDKIIEDYYG